MSTEIKIGKKGLKAIRFCGPAREGKDTVRVCLYANKEIIFTRKEWQEFSKNVQEAFDEYPVNQ